VTDSTPLLVCVLVERDAASLQRHQHRCDQRIAAQVDDIDGAGFAVFAFRSHERIEAIRTDLRITMQRLTRGGGSSGVSSLAVSATPLLLLFLGRNPESRICSSNELFSKDWLRRKHSVTSGHRDVESHSEAATRCPLSGGPKVAKLKGRRQCSQALKLSSSQALNG
jgi:hypothetical protein